MRITYDELANAERTQARPEKRTKTLPLDGIGIARGVFQPRLPPERDGEADETAEVQLLWDLTKVLKDHRKPLDPLLVTFIGTHAYLIDGHSRYEAYGAAGWKRRVPVEWFEGNLADARMEAMRRNLKYRLRVSETSRLQAAWTLMRQSRIEENYHGRARIIADACGLTVSAVVEMYRTTLKNEAALQCEFWSDAARLPNDF